MFSDWSYNIKRASWWTEIYLLNNFESKDKGRQDEEKIFFFEGWHFSTDLPLKQKLFLTFPPSLLKSSQIFWMTALKGGFRTFRAHNGGIQGCKENGYVWFHFNSQPAKHRCLSLACGTEISNWSHFKGDRQWIMGHYILWTHNCLELVRSSGVGIQLPGAGGWECNGFWTLLIICPLQPL